MPQSPQTYKQLYAIAGYERYYQIARCFRDEATRADRTAEFTQLDMELAFVEPEELFELLEGLFALIWRELLGVELATPFTHLSWDEAMLRYGSDKPDTRFGCEIADLTDAFRETEFRGFRGVVDDGGVVRGLRLPGSTGVLAQGLQRPGGVRQVVGRDGGGLAPGQGRRRDRLADRKVSERGRAGRRSSARPAPPRATPCSWWRISAMRPCACWGRCGCTWESVWG